jgi:hypothetical protein
VYASTANGSRGQVPLCVTSQTVAVEQPAGLVARRRFVSHPAPRRGNIEGTPTRAPASTRGHSFPGDSFFLRGFRARDEPAVPALPALELNGKEGSTVRVRQRALQRPRKTGSLYSGRPTLPRLARVWKAFWKNGSFSAYPAAVSWSVPLKLELCSTRTQKWASGAGTPWPGHRKGAPMQGSVCEASQRSRSRSTCFERRASHSTAR